MAWTTFAEPNVTNVTAMLAYANDVTGDKFGVLIPFMIFIVSYVAMSHHPPSKSILSAGFITLVLSVLLRMLGIVPDWIVIVLIILTGAGVVFFGSDK